MINMVKEGGMSQGREALKEALWHAIVQIFSLGFDQNSSKLERAGIPPDKLSSSTLERTLGDKVFEGFDIVGLYKENHPDTRNYSPACRRALDAYIQEQALQNVSL